MNQLEVSALRPDSRIERRKMNYLGEGAGFYFEEEEIRALLFKIEKGGWKNLPLSLDISKKYISEKILSTNNNFSDVIILNNDREEYLDLSEYKARYLLDRRKMVHPLPYLIHSLEKEHTDLENKDKGLWNGDRLEVVRSFLEVPVNYENVSNDFMFFESEDEQSNQQNKFYHKTTRARVKRKDRKLDVECIEVIPWLDKEASFSEVIEALRINEESEICFKKVSGEIVTRLATLGKGQQSSNSGSYSEDYIWFYDIEEEKLKRCKTTGFISLKAVAV